MCALSTRPSLHDETLRDGLQSPSVNDPTIEQKVEILHLLDSIGVDSVNLGLPAAGPRAFADVVVLAKEIASARLSIRAGCAGRTLPSDIAPMAEASQRAGIPIEAMLFIGSSPVRRYVEGWTVELIRERSVEAVRFARREGLPVTYVTEDTTRTPPATLLQLFTAVIGEGAARLCLCDTVGHATPDGATNLVAFTRNVVAGTGSTVGIDWHGHEDRGFSLANALAAMKAGADRIHGCVLGVGERVGNTPLELLIRNLELDGLLAESDPRALEALCRLVSEATGFPARPGHPYLTPTRGRPAGEGVRAVTAAHDVEAAPITKGTG